MNSLVKNIFKNTIIYALVFSMVFSSFITGSSVSILNSLIEAHANNFVTGSPKNASCGVCSEAYRYPPFQISLYRHSDVIMEGTDGFEPLFERLGAGIPNNKYKSGSFVAWSRYDTRFGDRISTTNTRYMRYEQYQDYGVNVLGSGVAIGNYLNILPTGNYAADVPKNVGVYYEHIKGMNVSEIEADFNAMLEGQGKYSGLPQAAKRAFSGMLYSYNGHETVFRIFETFTEIFGMYTYANPIGLDYGNYSEWSEEQRTEAWYRYLDFLICCAVNAGSAQPEWINAINDYISGDVADDNAISVVVEPGTFGVWRADGTMWTEFMTAYDFLGTTAALLEQDMMNSDAWWEAGKGSLENDPSVHGNFYSMFEKGYRNSFANYSNNLRHERTLNKSGSDLYSWAIGAIVKDRLKLPRDGSIVYNASNNTPDGYIGNATFRKNVAEPVSDPDDYEYRNDVMGGYSIYPAPGGGPREALGTLKATPDNYAIKTDIVPRPVDLTLYGSANEEQMETWQPLIEHADKKGYNFTIEVEWSSDADKFGLQSKIISNPTVITWDARTFEEWLKNNRAIKAYDAIQGQQFITDETLLFINYKADITIKVQTDEELIEDGGSCTDPASFIYVLEGITYTSTPEGYTEFKNFGVNSDFTGNLSEDFEAMAGVPSTEQMYFAAGGSEFIVDIALNEVNNETAYRTYDFYYSSVPCENKDGDQANTTYTVPSYTGIKGSGSDYTINFHGEDIILSQTITGTIRNNAVATKTATHEVSIAAIPNSTDVSERQSAYNSLLAWVEAAKKVNVEHTSVSDDYTRKTTIGAIGTVDIVEDWGVPEDTSASVACKKTSTTACQNEKATVSRGADYTWTMTATITVPAHAICGPCCKHDITEIHDTWKTSFTYDSMEINNIHIWRLDQGAIEGLEEIIDVDVVGADIVTEAPTIWYNIALKNDPNYKKLAYGEGYGGATATNHADVGRVWYHTYREEMDSVTIELGTRENFCDGTSKTDVGNVKAAGGNGHEEVWGKKGFTYEYAVDKWAPTPLTGSQHKGETDSTLNPGGDVEYDSATKTYRPINIGNHELLSKTDQYDKVTKEYYGFLEERDRQSGVTMVTDYLILQTSGGDQSVMYYEQSASSLVDQDSVYNPVDVGGLNPNYAHGEIGGPIADVMWYDNPLSAAEWEPDSIYVGSYNGRYFREPEKKYGIKDAEFTFTEVKTAFDNEEKETEGIEYIEEDMLMQERPKRPEHKTMIYEGDLNIILSNQNDKYITGYSEVYWSNQLHWANINYQRVNRRNEIVDIYRNEYTENGQFYKLAHLSTETFQFKEMPNTGYVYDSGETLIDEGVEIYTDIVAEDYGTDIIETDEKNLGLSGHQFGIKDFQVHGGYVMEGKYSPSHTRCNDIIIYNPVSTQDTQLISLPGYRDQRTKDSIKGGAQDLIDAIAKNQVCPEEAALCDYRTLNCKFMEDQLVFHADFDTLIDGKFVNLVSKKVNKKNDTVTYDEFTVPPGMRIEKKNGLSGNNVLSAFAPRLSIPFNKLGITYQPSLTLKVEADILLEPNGGDQMIFSFNGYGLYLPAKDENGQDSNRFVYLTTGNGLERKVKVPLADGEKHKITVEFSMYSLDYCKVWIDGEEVGLLTINESNTLSSALIGGYFNIGGWNKDNDYGAAFYLDNLKITRKAGTADHNETCYTRDVTHGNALNAHRHTALCLSLEDNTYNVDKKFEYTGDVQIFTIPSDGYYKLEAWGASGGGSTDINKGSHGGLGGYTTGTAYFQKGEQLYIYVGGVGSVAPGGGFGGAGYNGGGFGANYGYGGGGMTHISTTQNPAMNKRDEIVVSEKGEQEFLFTGTIQEFVAPATGNYTFELYGASGGDDGSSGGLGGKTTGIVSLPKGMKVYIVVGGEGASSASGTGGGYNGGGHAGSVGSSGAGGGATHIGFRNKLLKDVYDEAGTVLMVAGGGGGAGNSYAGMEGGAGGGESHNAPEGSYGGDYTFGRGQDRDETGGNKDGGGGGGGWYGGFASYGDGGGAGGTGYVDDSILNGATESGVNDGNGKVLVTWDIHIDNSGYSEKWNPKGTLIVAGGGGGADNNTSEAIGQQDDGSGGHGGGLTAQGYTYAGVIKNDKVATQTSGYAQGIGESATVLTDTGGAGGGWYGGYASNYGNGGAGGGSSYVYGYTGTNRTEITDLSINSDGTRQFKNVQVSLGVNNPGDNGHVRITKVGSVMDQILDSMNGSYGLFTEDELKDYFGDAYEYLKKEDPLTILKSYSDFKESSNGFYSLVKGSKPDVTALDDGSVRIGGTSGYEAALSTDIEAGSVKYIEVIYAKGSDASNAKVQLNKERTFTAGASTNENGDKVCLINVEEYAKGMHITDVYFDLGSSGYSTVKQINFLGYGVTSTEIREYDIASGGLIEDTVKLWANPFGKSTYRITLVGAGGGDARIVNTANVIKDSGGAGAYLTGKSPISAGAEIAITVGGRGQDQASTSAVAQGNKVTFNYSGTEQVYTAPVDGRYYIEAYGASGGGAVIGEGASHGGRGGMTSGFVDLKKDDKLYIYVGGQGKSSSGYGNGGGYNGGGHAGPGGYGGGGMTHISTTKNPATASVEITSKPAEPSYFEGTVTVNGKGTYKVMDFVSPVTGTMDIKFYCSNGHLTGYYVEDSLGNRVDTGNVHKGTYSEAEVWMYDVSLVQGSTYGLYLYSECGNFADPDTSKADRSQVVTASFSTQGGITEFYEAKGDWNPEGTILVAAGGGGADAGNDTTLGGPEGITVIPESAGNAGDGSGGYGGGIAGQNALLDGKSSTSTTSYRFDYTGKVQTFTAPVAGSYTLEAFGASGGIGYGEANPTGLGGYTKGTVQLKAGDTLYIYVGQHGISYYETGSAAWNGGGAVFDGESFHKGGSGGGATDFRLVSGNWDNAAGLQSRILVAGGGGGAQSSCGGAQTTAGHGGGITGGRSDNSSEYYNGSYALGGTQSAGGTGYSPQAPDINTVGAFGAGAKSLTCAAGGGGGYYGGGSSYTAGGGGGSSYVTGYTGCDTTYRDKQGGYTFTDVDIKQGVNDGHGYAIITAPYVLGAGGVTGESFNKEFSYTGSEQQITLDPGTYKIEAWGAQGGSIDGYTGGKGGYTTGTIILDKTTTLYINVGGAGDGATGNMQNLNGGYNGGGSVIASSTNNNHICASGGGATHIAAESGLLSSLNNSKGSILIVAGGGGGARNQSNHVEAARWGNGGAGGGATGGGAISSYGNTSSYTTVTANAGTQTTGNAFGQGGNGESQSGGGGGYYGGYSGNGGPGGYTGSGSGGSSYAASAGTYALSSVEMQQGINSGHGKVRITSVAQDSSLSSKDGSGFMQGVGESATSSSTGYGDVAGAGAGWYGGTASNHGNGGAGGGSSYASEIVIYGDTVADKQEGNGVVYITEPLLERPDDADGKGGYNGGGDGGIEFGEKSPESGAGGGGMTDMRVDGNFFAIAAGGGGAASHINSNYNGIATKAAYGKQWARVLYQDISNNTNYFTTATMGSVDQEGLYSCLNVLEQFRGEDGKFEFMLEYPDSVYYADTPNIWKQSSNPYTQQKNNGTNAGEDAEGFESISYPMYDSGYGGGLEFNGHNSVLDGSVNHNDWWLCVGIMNTSFSSTNGQNGKAYTLPGPVGPYGDSTSISAKAEGVSKVALWVRIDNTNVDIASLKDKHFGGDAGTVLTDGQATNGYTEAGTQESGYRLPDVLEPDNIGFGQSGQNGVRSKNYGTVGGGGAGWFGGAQIIEYKASEAMGGAGGSSYLQSEWTEFESHATNHGDGSFDLNEFRETLIIKKGTYDSEITTDVIMKYYTLIPDLLPDGRWNPLWGHCKEENNIHVCDDTCEEFEILTCTEPHHNGNHYGPHNEVCWEACMNDANHKTVAPNATADGTFDGGNFINLDYGFEIFFPNRSLLSDKEPYGVGALTTEKGKGFTNIYEANENIEYYKSQYVNTGCCSPLNGLAEVTENPYLRGVTPQIEPGTGANYLGTEVGTNVTKWTRVKRIKFTIDVIYDPTPTGTSEYSENAKMYLAGEWITLGDRGTYTGALGGIGSETADGKYDPTAWTNYGTGLYEGIYRDRYQFYCVMENNEQKAASYTVEVTALNALDFEKDGFGQKNDNSEKTNRRRSANFTAKHGAINIFYYDVVGRIGNLVLEDTEDFRFSNLFKQTVEQMDSTSTIQNDMFYVGKDLGLEDTEGLDNDAIIHDDYIVTGSTGSYAAVKGYNATQNFYKVEITGKSLTAGRLAVINTADEYKELSDDKFTTIQYSAERISYYIDMTGFTDTTTVIDFKYVAKAANTMVINSITVSKLGKSPDGWVLDGIVQEVDPTKQKTVFDWVSDIRGITLSASTRQQNTWGAIPWIEQVGHMDLPLSPDKNNIEVLKAEPMLVGYNGLFDIQTLGNYWEVGTTLKVVPRYWAINNSTKEVIPLDVYMQHDGVYEPINLHGNVDASNKDAPLKNEIYNDVVNLDWENEHPRRNYYGREDDEEGDVMIDGELHHYKIVVPERAFCVEDLGITWEAKDDYLDTNDPNVTEHYRTLAVWIETLPSRELLEEQLKDAEMGSEEGSPTVNIGELLANRQPLEMPGGHINTLGNRQYLSLDGNARTFVGGIATYDKLQDIGARIADFKWYRQGQRWYFTIGLPSASVFVQKDHDVSISEIKRIQEGGYTVFCSLGIIAQGSVWHLEYKHRWDGSEDQSMYPYYDTGGGHPEQGEITLIGTSANGEQVSLGAYDLNNLAHIVDYDPIVFVYNPAIDSRQDVEIVGTH